jgi:hypothetical protein
VVDGVKLEKRKKITGNYEALVALCEAVGVEIERLGELEQRGLIRPNTRAHIGGGVR